MLGLQFISSMSLITMTSQIMCMIRGRLCQILTVILVLTMVTHLGFIALLIDQQMAANGLLQQRISASEEGRRAKVLYRRSVSLEKWGNRTLFPTANPTDALRQTLTEDHPKQGILLKSNKSEQIKHSHFDWLMYKTLHEAKKNLTNERHSKNIGILPTKKLKQISDKTTFEREQKNPNMLTYSIKNGNNIGNAGNTRLQQTAQVNIGRTKVRSKTKVTRHKKPPPSLVSPTTRTPESSRNMRMIQQLNGEPPSPQALDKSRAKVNISGRNILIQNQHYVISGNGHQQPSLHISNTERKSRIHMKYLASQKGLSNNIKTQHLSKAHKVSMSDGASGNKRGVGTPPLGQNIMNVQARNPPLSQHPSNKRPLSDGEKEKTASKSVNKDEKNGIRKKQGSGSTQGKNAKVKNDPNTKGGQGGAPEDIHHLKTADKRLSGVNQQGAKSPKMAPKVGDERGGYNLKKYDNKQRAGSEEAARKSAYIMEYNISEDKAVWEADDDMLDAQLILHKTTKKPSKKVPAAKLTQNPKVNNSKATTRAPKTAKVQAKTS